MTVISNVKQTVATLKNIDAQLSHLAINSEDEKAKKAFHETMITIEEISNDLQMRVVEIETEEPQYKSN
ncbi:DUF1657 domain-containing protein [Sutcliffiella cohnii]